MENIGNEYKLNPIVTYATFIDLKKLFDTVSDEKLMEYDEKCGQRGSIQYLLKSYWTIRSQVVKILSEMSMGSETGVIPYCSFQ